MKKKLMLYLVIISILIGSLAPVYANEIPNAFWGLNTKYQNALVNNNQEQTIKYGWEIIDLFKDKEDTGSGLNIITPRLEHIAKAYEANGDYENAVKTYKKYIPFAEKQGWDDGVAYAKSKIRSLDYSIDLYIKNFEIEENQYFGAKYEPKAGMYFGSAYDNDARIGNYNWDKIQEYFPKKNSAYLIYLEWGNSINSLDRFFQAAKTNGTAVELAWNTYKSQTKQNIEEEKSYIEATANYLKQLNIPIFLRFAGEMNLGDRGKDPVAYVKAFQYVSQIMKEMAPNVAMVWSPNDISEKGRGYEEYYPGDEYVDWVGLSSYTDKYFQGKKDWGELQDTLDSVYFTGKYANPLAKIGPFVEFLEEKQINKPMLLTENGVAHYAKHENEDLTEWAKVQLQRLYIYGPMIYPRLKGMFYFNVNGDEITKNHAYALYTNPDINKLYNELVSNDFFLEDIGKNSAFSYEKIKNNTFTGTKISLMTYTVDPKVLKPIVEYKINGQSQGKRTEIPYTIDIDFSKFENGNHKLNIEVYDEDKRIGNKEYQVTINENKVEIRNH